MTRRILLLSFLYIVIILVFAWLRPEETDWRPSFSPDETKPFASKILYLELPSIRNELIELADRPVYNILSQRDLAEQQIYFLLNKAFQPSEPDIRLLLEFAAHGNHVFIASAVFPDDLMDTLNLNTRFTYVGSLDPVKWFYEDNITLSLYGKPEHAWNAAASHGYQWFESRDSTALDTLGLVGNQHPNFIACPFGKGTFYLHAFPYIFTNYHMLYESNHRYISGAIGMIPGGSHWIWDKYYTEDHLGTAGTPLIALNQHRSFRWAYWMGVITLLIFIVFTAKRRQRVIPLLKPKRNRTLDYVRTIGDLYFHRADHRDLAMKKIDILRAQLSKKYRVEVQGFTEEEASIIAARRQEHAGSADQLLATVRATISKEQTSVRDLQRLQQELDRFFGRGVLTHQPGDPVSR